MFIAGQVADDVSLDTEGQTRQILAKIDQLLEECGSDKSKILSSQCWVTDVENFDGMNKAWDDWADTENRPARAALCCLLTRPEFLVEIMVTAARDP